MQPFFKGSLISCLLCVQVLCSGFAAYAQQADPEGFRAGAARQEIVPPFPTRMGGFFDRTGTFTGVESPIYARALACESGAVRLAVVSTDLLDITKELVASSRAAIEKKTGIPAENILIAAAHNHSAPAGFKRINHYGGGFDKPLFNFLVERITLAVVDAHAALTPARLGFDFGRLERFTRNRQQDNETVIDPDVGVLKVTKADSREVIAILFNFAGHPVVLGSDNLLISGEYTGHAAQTIESVLGGVALFTQGACGDVTVHRSGPPLLEIKRLGHVLAGEVIKTAGMIRPTDDSTLVSKFLPVEVQPRKLPTPERAKELLTETRKAYAEAKARGVSEQRLRRLRRDADATATTLRIARFFAEQPSFFENRGHASVHVLQIGPLVMVGIPGELFVEYALEMKQRVRQAKNRPLVVAGFANDSLGYIITPRALHTGGYEQAIAIVDQLAGRVLTEAAMGLVDEFVK